MNRHRAFALLVTAVLAVAGLVLPGSPAHAAVHCEGAGCNGKKVSDTDCKPKAYAIAGLALTDFDKKVVARGDLWYSPTCQAMWGDFNSTGPDVYSNVRIIVQPEYGGVNSTPFAETIFGPGNVTTTMVDWQQSVKLCASGDGSEPTTPVPGAACTTWR